MGGEVLTIKLTGIAGFSKGKEFTIEEGGEATIGRSRTCSFRIGEEDEPEPDPKKPMKGTGGKDGRRIDAELGGDSLQGVTRLHDVAGLRRGLLGMSEDDAEGQQDQGQQASDGKLTWATIQWEVPFPLQRGEFWPTRAGRWCGAS